MSGPESHRRGSANQRACALLHVCSLCGILERLLHASEFPLSRECLARRHFPAKDTSDFHHADILSHSKTDSNIFPQRVLQLPMRAFLDLSTESIHHRLAYCQIEFQAHCRWAFLGCPEQRPGLRLRYGLIFLAGNDSGLFRFVIVNALACCVERTKADDDNVNVRLAARLAFPCKCAVGEMNFQIQNCRKSSVQSTPTCSPCVIEFVETKPTMICVFLECTQQP